MMKVICSAMSSLGEQSYIISTSLMVSAQEAIQSVSAGATDHQEGPAVPKVQVHPEPGPTCVPWKSLASLSPDKGSLWKAELLWKGLLELDAQHVLCSHVHSWAGREKGRKAPGFL